MGGLEISEYLKCEEKLTKIFYLRQNRAFALKVNIHSSLSTPIKFKARNKIDRFKLP